MPIEQFATYGKNDTLQQTIETTAQNFEITEVLFNGGLDSLNIRRLTADKINTGTLDAGKVTIKVDYATGASITLDSNGMTINDGTKDTFRVDINGQVTMTGAQVQSADGTYPRVEMNSSNELFGAYVSVDKFIEIFADIVGGQPFVRFKNGTNCDGLISPLTVGMLLINTVSGAGDISISSGENLDLFANDTFGYKVRVQSWDDLYSIDDTQTLQVKFNSLQSNINAKANGSGVNGSFTAGTNTVIVTNGIITAII